MACEQDAELSILIVDDAAMAELNERYLGHQGPTNVISFAMGEGEQGRANQTLLGDVIISADTTRDHAIDGGLAFEEVLDFYLIHGILHLLGFEHEAGGTKARQMEERQAGLMAMLYDTPIEF